MTAASLVVGFVDGTEVTVGLVTVAALVVGFVDGTEVTFGVVTVATLVVGFVVGTEATVGVVTAINRSSLPFTNTWGQFRFFRMGRYC